MNTSASNIQKRRVARVITTTSTILLSDTIIIVENGATNITINIPTLLHNVFISRGASSTGSITIQYLGGNIQSLNRTIVASTSLSAIGNYGDSAEFIKHPTLNQLNRL